MTNNDRYKYDPDYRQKALERNRRNHHKWARYPVFRELRKVRVSICNYRDSIEDAANKIEMYKEKIKIAIIRKEELELEFGRLRAKLKRGVK